MRPLLPNRRTMPREYEQAMERIRTLIQREARPFGLLTEERREQLQRLPDEQWMREFFPHWVNRPSAPFHAAADERSSIAGIPLFNCWGSGMGKTVRYVILKALRYICDPHCLWLDHETGLKTFEPTWAYPADPDDAPMMEQAEDLIHIAIACHTFDSAATKTDLVRLELLHNPRLRQVYGDAIRPQQGKNEDGDFVANGKRLFARGVGQSLRGELFNGRRVQALLCDDLENERIGYSRDAQDTLRRQLFNDWYPRMEGSGSRGALHVQLNMYGPVCLAEHARELSEKVDEAGNPGCLYVREPWEDEQGESRWPDQIATVELRGIRLRIGDAAYRTQYLVLVANENATFQPQWFVPFSLAKLGADSPELVAAMQKVLWHDTSWTARESSDFKAIILLGRPRRSEDVFCLHAWIRKVTGEEAARELCRVHALYPDAVIWIEGNGGAQMAYEALYKLMAAEHLEPGYWQYEINTENKDTRVCQWIGEHSRGLCHYDVSQGDQRLLVDQFCDWGQRGAKRDGPDAWAGARQMLGPAQLGSRIVVARHMPRIDRGALVGLGRGREIPPVPGSHDETADRWGEDAFDRMAREAGGLVF